MTSLSSEPEVLSPLLTSEASVRGVALEVVALPRCFLTCEFHAWALIRKTLTSTEYDAFRTVLTYLIGSSRTHPSRMNGPGVERCLYGQSNVVVSEAAHHSDSHGFTL